MECSWLIFVVNWPACHELLIIVFSEWEPYIAGFDSLLTREANKKGYTISPSPSLTNTKWLLAVVEDIVVSLRVAMTEVMVPHTFPVHIVVILLVY